MTYAVGSLVAARGREWVVLPDTDDEVLRIRPVGASDDEATGLLLALEGARVTPARFAHPTVDDIGDFHSSRLLRDALRLGFRSSAGPFRSFGRIAVTPRPYQLVPLLMALKLDPVRLLIADDVGIGKTVEALLIAREMIDQGDVQRMTVLCSPQLAEQWKQEMATKFHLDAEVVLPSTAKRLDRTLSGPGESIFERHPITVVSTDFIKSDRRRDEFLRSAPELVIVDEAHTGVQADGGRGSGRHQRHELLKGLARDPNRHLLLVTATPHSGKEDGFRALLELLDGDFANLPADLTGAAHEADRRRVAGHFVQRRRKNIATYLDEQTTFPTRETTEVTYRLHDDYARLFDRALDLARETVTDETGGQHRQRVRWWSALALLRSLASSPAAAAQTLRNRAAAAEAGSVREADEIGRRTVLDLADDDATEGIDVPPGSDPDEDSDDGRLHRRLQALARDAEGLHGDKDHKLATVAAMVAQLVKDGFNPILFCRFIPTAEYVAAELRDVLPNAVTVAAVTGSLAPSEREARVAELGASDGPRVLVATDCMSEGINLQDHFDAVIHYDLSWNPTRHEQREGRVDRYGQPSDTVRAVTYWGEDNRIDEIVLDVLLRKHNTIRSALGVSVPVPGDSDQVVEAIMEGILTRDGGTQLPIDAIAEQQQQELFREWEDAAEREQRSRTMFAQQAIHVDEVAAEVAAVRRAIGSADTVAEFMVDAASAWGARVTPGGDTADFDFAEAGRTVQDLLRPRPLEFTATWELPAEDDQLHLSRTHPVVEHLAQHVIDVAVDPQLDGIAARAGVTRTDAVASRTTLLLVRYRYNLTQVVDGEARPLLAEEARSLAFTGPPDEPSWLASDEAEALFAARPTGNVTADQKASFITRVVNDWPTIESHLNDQAQALATELLDQHRRVRDAARRRGVRFDVTPHLPPDVLGLYVLLPGGGA